MGTKTKSPQWRSGKQAPSYRTHSFILSRLWKFYNSLLLYIDFTARALTNYALATSYSLLLNFQVAKNSISQGCQIPSPSLSSALLCTCKHTETREEALKNRFCGRRRVPGMVSRVSVTSSEPREEERNQEVLNLRRREESRNTEPEKKREIKKY